MYSFVFCCSIKLGPIVETFLLGRNRQLEAKFDLCHRADPPDMLGPDSSPSTPDFLDKVDFNLNLKPGYVLIQS